MSQGYVIGLTAAEARQLDLLWRDYCHLRAKIPFESKVANSILDNCIDPVIGKLNYFERVIENGLAPWASHIHETPSASETGVG